jgi:hypothetical protein
MAPRQAAHLMTVAAAACDAVAAKEATAVTATTRQPSPMGRARIMQRSSSNDGDGGSSADGGSGVNSTAASAVAGGLISQPPPARPSTAGTRGAALPSSSPPARRVAVVVQPAAAAGRPLTTRQLLSGRALGAGLQLRRPGRPQAPSGPGVLPGPRVPEGPAAPAGSDAAVAEVAPGPAAAAGLAACQLPQGGEPAGVGSSAAEQRQPEQGRAQQQQQRVPARQPWWQVLPSDTEALLWRLADSDAHATAQVGFPCTPLSSDSDERRRAGMGVGLDSSALPASL